MPWSPRGQVTVGQSVWLLKRSAAGAEAPPVPVARAPRSTLRSDFYTSPLPSSESRGLACGLWVTRGVSHLSVSAPQPSQAPCGDTSNSCGDQDPRPGRRQQALPSPTMWQERSAETRHSLRTEIRCLHLAHGYELNAGSHLLPHALRSPPPAVPALLPPCL